MASNAQRGARAKGRTRKFLEGLGYQVGSLEVVHWIFRNGERFPVKHDQFASDLIAVNDRDVVFVQVKGGKAAAGGNFPAARRAFAEFVFPPYAKRWVVAWPPRARQPRIVDCSADGVDRAEATRDLKQGVKCAAKASRRIETRLF